MKGVAKQRREDRSSRSILAPVLAKACKRGDDARSSRLGKCREMYEACNGITLARRDWVN